METTSESGVVTSQDRRPTRKDLKLAHLPLSQDQRSTINNLLNVFKKKGEYDVLRKAVYAKFDESQAKANLITSLEHLAEREIEKSSSLLSKERRIAAALIEGAAERSDIYRVAEADVDGFVSELMNGAETTLRDIRRDIVGEEQALKELDRGQKTDADYAAEADERRRCRKLVREEEVKIRLKREIEEREQQAEETRRKKEELEIREREQKEFEEIRRAEKENQAELEKHKERERRRRYEEEREQEKEERRERRRCEEEIVNKNGRVHTICEVRNIPIKGERRKAERERDLEEVALELLLREGQELAAKSKNRSETEKPESLETPNRKSLENKVKHTTNDIEDDDKLSKYSVEDHELNGEFDTGRIQKPIHSVSRGRREPLSGNVVANADKDRDQGKHNKKESCIETQEPDDSRNNTSGGKTIRVDRYSQEKETDRRDSNISRGPAALFRRRSLISANLDIADRNHSPRKRQRTRSRSPESIDRYVPSSARGHSNEREPHRYKHGETPRRSQREEGKQPAHTHRYNLDDRYSSNDSRESYNRERRDRSRDRDRGRDYHEPHEGTRWRDRDMDRTRRSSRDRDRDRYVERERNRIAGSERDSLRDQERDRDRDRHRDRAYEKERERRRYEDYQPIRRRSRERDQDRKWSR